MNHCVYFLLKNDVIIYIGQSCNVKGRIYQHNLDKDFDECRIIYVKNRERALHYERRLVNYFQPELNYNLTEETVVIRVRKSLAPRIAKWMEEDDEVKRYLISLRNGSYPS